MGQGVCLEYANLACTLLRGIGYNSKSVWVIIAYGGSKGKEGHAFIQIDQKFLEPQSGVPYHNQDLIRNYLPAYKYNDTACARYKSAGSNGIQTAKDFVKAGQ